MSCQYPLSPSAKYMLNYHNLSTDCAATFGTASMDEEAAVLLVSLEDEGVRWR